MWSFQRYRNWLETRKNWHIPSEVSDLPDGEPAIARAGGLPALPAKPRKSDTTPTRAEAHGPIEIEPIEGGFEKILKKLE
jgi:hypothetical protein